MQMWIGRGRSGGPYFFFLYSLDGGDEEMLRRQKKKMALLPYRWHLKKKHGAGKLNIENPPTET